MNRFASGLLAAGLAFATALTGVMPATAAAPAAVRSMPAVADGAAPALNVQYTNRELRRLRRADRVERRIERRADRRARNFERRGDRYYYRGYRGYRERRAGYRSYNGFWFPAAAFVAGAIASGAVSGGSRTSAHIDWCQNRYRSYRASDNTFQPYNGPRQQCRSPY